MPLFAKRTDCRVKSFLLKLLNTNCPGIQAMREGARLDRRVNLVLVVAVVPMKSGKIQPEEAFRAVTKEFSNTGVAIVLDGPRKIHEAVLGFRLGGEMVFVRAEAKHLDPMGGGFFQLGFHLREVVSAGDYPALETIAIS